MFNLALFRFRAGEGSEDFAAESIFWPPGVVYNDLIFIFKGDGEIFDGEIFYKSYLIFIENPTCFIM